MGKKLPGKRILYIKKVNSKGETITHIFNDYIL